MCSGKILISLRIRLLEHFNLGLVLCQLSISDLLGEAMAATNVQEALQSLSLQKQYHIQQKDVVRMKQRRAKVLGQRTGPVSPPTYTINDDHVQWPHDGSNEVPPEDAMDGDTAEEHNGVYRTMKECDSLLQFLNHRQSLDYRSLVPPTSSSAYASNNGSRSPKDDKVIIEELKTHNDALRGHVMDMLRDLETQAKDLEHYKAENGRLHARLRDMEKMNRSQMTESVDSELEYQPMHLRMNLDDLTSLELPPLEMPKFDLDSFKTGLEKHGNS